MEQMADMVREDIESGIPKHEQQNTNKYQFSRNKFQTRWKFQGEKV